MRQPASAGSKTDESTRPKEIVDAGQKTQIWISIAVYVLIAIVKKRLALDATLYQILQVLSVTLFEKTPILRAFDDQDSQEKSASFSNQLNLLDF